ncbi:DUF4166 domain-containing protein [Gryllotalpicola daejeonensis]|uniref:DUF4166 domain-containing protein n=1 Tax=Gryllotalpicola daejeonensis TaxID=993087 RepID=A0ABP7ZE83_9MICO
MNAPGEPGGVYRSVLGASFAELHPRLRTYFSPIPAGSVGRGAGVFERVGTRPAWLRPLVRLLFDRSHVLTARWGERVPFTVVNRPASTDAGAAAVAAERRIAFPSGEWTMVDEISAAGPHPRVGDGAGIRDLIGSPPRLDVLLDAQVQGGALEMRSRAATLILGRVRMPVPRPLAPTVTLTEQWDDSAAKQRVSVTVRAPLFGTIYEYAGTFSYAIESAGESA